MNESEHGPKIRADLENEIWALGERHPESRDQVIRILQQIARFSDAVEQDVRNALFKKPGKSGVEVFRHFIASVQLALRIEDQKTFAGKLGISQQMISRMLLGTPAKLNKHYINLCTKAGVTIEEVLSDFPDPSKRQQLIDRAAKELGKNANGSALTLRSDNSI